MIYLRISGGLGNQMFQYAAGLSLAKSKNTTLGICLEILENREVGEGYTYRKFELESVFNLPPFKKVLGEQIDFYLDHGIGIFQKIKRKLIPHSVFIEKSLEFDPRFLSLKSESVIDGYFQSEKYILTNQNEILDAFGFQLQKLNSKSKELSTNFPEDTLAIHVRRGDYVQNKAINSVHGSCSIDYYHKGVERLKQNGISKIFVFSDDPEWVKQNLSFDIETEYVDWNEKDDSWQDMYLMSKSKYFIIANSSFSWWGAYLSQVQGKKVIAPSRWFADDLKNQQTKDLIPASWIKI